MKKKKYTCNVTKEWNKNKPLTQKEKDEEVIDMLSYGYTTTRMPYSERIKFRREFFDQISGSILYRVYRITRGTK